MPLSWFAAAGRPAGAGDPSPAPASSATSVYWTHLGAITLTWSRTKLGLLLAAELRIAGDAEAPEELVLRPWLPWRRRGSKRFRVTGHAVVFSWDLSRARFAGRRPEPLSRYFVLVTVDGELALAAGDLASPASAAGVLLSRRENAVAGADRGGAYTTSLAVAGEKHEVSLAVEDAAMWVAVDGRKALQVRRLRWKFRGSERLDLAGCGVRISWDLHGWLFTPGAAAVFVLRFETVDTDEADAGDAEEDADMQMHSAKQSSFRNHHAAATGGGGGEGWCSSDSDRRGWRRGPFRSGSDSSPTVSVASTSAASSAGSVATVAEWATVEDAALKDGGGFSLVIHLWKKRR